MKIRSYLIILILGYSVCGIAVFALLNFMNQSEARFADNVSQSRLNLRDVGSLEQNLSHWMLLSDLVLGSDESYLCRGALQLGAEVDEVLDTLASQVGTRHRATVVGIQEFSRRQKGRLKQSQSLNDSDRSTRIGELLLAMDSDAEATIGNLQQFHNEIQNELRENKAALDLRLSNRKVFHRTLLFGFLGSTLLLWLWISALVSKPISMLANQSRIKDESLRDFKVSSSAPNEVKQLAASLSELITDLEYQIGEHKKTQIERARLHRGLMDASRRAGMADVASEVLHNVGNVLNSINVSATVMNSSLKDSLLPKLVVANQQFAEHQSDYGSYLDEDDRGKHFPAALDYMVKELVNEQNVNLGETEQLLKNVSHVRHVIQGQLSLSRDEGVIETFCLSELLVQCVSINDGKANRVKATVNVDCPETLNLVTDRHKLQQILINLISNALDAIHQHAPTGGCVEVVAYRKSGDVEIVVTDNGIGITTEDLSKVFSQGFTTKEDGYGFGLHSCAMTAQVIGGNLNVTSKGAGQGASFQLEIPMSQKELCKI